MGTRIFPLLDDEEYLSRVEGLAHSQGLHIAGSLSNADASSTKAFYIDHHQRRQVSMPAKGATPAQIIAAISDLDLRAGSRACGVFIVENIGPAYIEALGVAWRLDPSFFVDHALNRDREHLWTPYIFRDEPARIEEKRHSFIDGIFEYHGICVHTDAELSSSPNHLQRHCFRSTWDNVETIVSNTRISYYQVHRELCKFIPKLKTHVTDNAMPDLFLVDAPLSLQKKYKTFPRRIRPSLRLPYAVNRGGLLLPQLLEESNFEDGPYSVFEALKSVFNHGWQRSILFRYDGLFPAPPLCYMLSNSLWQTNLQYLTREIQRISFEEIRNPDPRINETLHDLREDLVSYLISGLSKTTNYVPETITTFWGHFRERYGVMQNAMQHTPVTSHHNALESAAKLEKLLMETFQLLMSSISVQDARMSIEQSHLSNQQALRATQLTILASIYVPLSFVTGVFGMNLKQLNGSGLSIWVFFVGIVIATIVTAVIFLGLQVHSKQKGSRRDAKKANDTDMPSRRARATSNVYNENFENERTVEKSKV